MQENRPEYKKTYSKVYRIAPILALYFASACGVANVIPEKLGKTSDKKVLTSEIAYDQEPEQHGAVTPAVDALADPNPLLPKPFEGEIVYAVTGTSFSYESAKAWDFVSDGSSCCCSEDSNKDSFYRQCTESGYALLPGYESCCESYCTGDVSSLLANHR
jgi:hypothetical protein